MSLSLESFLSSTNPIAKDYSRFRVTERILLTGHSHQAWPDVAFEGQMEAFQDAAQLVDSKWTRAFEKAERVKLGFRQLLGGDNGDYVLAPNTHDLLLRLLSCLDLKDRRQIVTTAGEFHSARRQFERLREEGFEVLALELEPFKTLAQRLADAVSHQTAMVFTSAVMFETSRVLSDLRVIQESALEVGAIPVFDVYHALNVREFDLPTLGIEKSFIIGGGYKYAQLGEGNCFLRIPPGLSLRPVITGWYAEFSSLEKAPEGKTAYGKGGDRLAGSTYDPTSHYRASRVFDYFENRGLTPKLLQEINQRQILILREEFDRLRLVEFGLDYDRSLRPNERGGFLAIQVSGVRTAPEIVQSLQDKGVWSDCRGRHLRLGPAPHLTPDQLSDAMGILKSVLKS